MPPRRAALALACAWGAACWGGPPARAGEFFQDLRTDLQEDHVRLTGAGAGDRSRLTTRGLLFSVPGGRKAKLPIVGVAMKKKITGDFEATAEYELLKVAQPDGGYGAGVVLWAYPAGKTGKISVGRSEHPQRGSVLTAYHAPVGTDANKGHKEFYPTQSAKGGLRLVRTGTTVRFLATEGGGPYRERHGVDYGDVDLREVGVFVDTGGALTAMDVLLKSFKVAGPDLVVDEDYPAPEPTPPAGVIAAVVAVGVVPILLALASRARARFARARAG
jgi:hypothetical protein